MSHLIGVDVGTSSLKALAVDPDGRVLGVAERPLTLSTPRPGWSEQDPEAWWAAASAALAELDAAHAAGIGLTGQMHGLVCLDEADRPLRPAILWNDGRAQPQGEALERRLGLDGLVAATGNRALAGFTAPKLAWVAEHEPDVHARIARVALPKDHVRLRLCGTHATDVSDASGTLLLDVARREWSERMLAEVDVAPGWLPTLHESGAVSGETPDGVPVAAGAGDQAAGALGVGVTRGGGPASIVLGTSGAILAAQDAYAADPEGRVHAFCHAVDGGWQAMGVMLSAAGSLRWLRDALGGAPSYDELLAEAAAWEPGCEGLLFAPYLAGERTPWADADIRGGFLGLGLRHDRGALVRAVLEGVAYGLADALDLVAATAGRPPSGRVSGGGARSELWLEIVASVLDLPLELTAVDEGAAYGAALLGGVAAGVFPDAASAAERCVRVVRTVPPRPDWVERYAQERPAFRASYGALAAVRDRAR